MYYASVIVPQRTKVLFYWSIPSPWYDMIITGMPVLVPLKNQEVMGIVLQIFHDNQKTPPLKPILAYYADHDLQLSFSQLKFWKWISSYYMCTLGEVMSYAFPSFLHQKKATYSISKSYQVEDVALTLEEQVLFTLLEKEGKLSAIKLYQRTNLNEIGLLLESLLRKKVITSSPTRRIKKILTAGEAMLSEERKCTLHEKQQKALDAIRTYYDSGTSVVLLQGITGSGKTHLYIELIKELLLQGKQVLMLVPEIRLTQDLFNRLSSYLGDAFFAYHSKLSPAKRLNVWRTVRRGSPVVIIGTRSAVFLPYTTLGLVICDEEHDYSYKQDQPAPRYHARDASIMLSNMVESKVLLGSATPSLESYYHAQLGKYGSVLLNERYTGTPLPDVQTFNLKSYLGKNPPAVWISPPVKQAANRAMEQGGQIIFFHNRRGYAPYVVCSSCGHIPLCSFCSVSITYHLTQDQFLCHYCGRTYQYHTCLSCDAKGSLVLKKAGTHRVLEAVKEAFPDAPAAIYDLDVAKHKEKSNQVLEAYRTKKLSILVATQMMSKGFDFEGTLLVVILDFESMLSFSDFRNNERLMQQIEQVGGRAGRREQQGEVWVQTLLPDHPLLRYVASHDYTAFADEELGVRKALLYPPFCRFIYVDVKSPKENQAKTYAQKIAKALVQNSLFAQGPVPPVVAKVNRIYTERIILKCSSEYKAYQKQKQKLQNVLHHFSSNYVKVDMNVDPTR